jgi:6-phosphofructokinase 1
LVDAFHKIGKLSHLPAFRLAGARKSYRLPFWPLKVGLLTAGGNAPGLNTMIDSIVKRHSILATLAGARETRDGIEGLEIHGYLGGYNGLLAEEESERRLPLTVWKTDPISSHAGSILMAKRGEVPKDGALSEKLAKRLAAAVKRDQLDILYVIGGNGTITGADALCEQLREIHGPNDFPVRVVAAPKTMDNDINYTDVTFGFRTTVNNANEILRRLHVEAETGGRIVVVELFGASSGFVALHAASASGETDYVLLPEMMGQTAEARRHELKTAAQLLARRFRRKKHAMLVVAEGASLPFQHGDAAGREKAFETLAAELATELKHELGFNPPLLLNRPQHLIRSTPPNSFDTELCKQTGKLMVDTALAGFSRCLVSSWQGRFCLVPMSAAIARLKQVNLAGYYPLSMMEKYRIEKAPAAKEYVEDFL